MPESTSHLSILSLEIFFPGGDLVESLDDVEVLGTCVFAGTALDAVCWGGFSVDEDAPFVMVFEQVYHFFVGFIGNEFAVVVLHVCGDWDVLGA